MLDPVRRQVLRPLVLCVHDDLAMGEALRQCLEPDDYEVVTFHDARAARHQLSEISPADLVVVEARIANSGGHALCREVRTIAGWERTPILIVLSDADEPAVTSALQAGATDYITKPIIGNVLRHRIRRMIEGQRAESRLESYESRVAGLMALIDEAILTYDDAGRIESFAPSAVRMFGISAAEAVGRPVQPLFLDLLAPSTDEMNYQTLRARRADGVEFIADISIHRVRDRGRLLTLLVARDTTQRAIAERERSALAERLRHARYQEALSTLSGGVAHDLNSVLTAVLGFAESARELTQDASAVDHLRNAESAVHRARRLVNQLLAYAGRAKPNLQPTDLNRLLLDLPGPVASAIGHYPRVDLKPASSPIYAMIDGDQIEYAVVQLIANAVEASADEERVSVRTGREHLDPSASASVQVNPGFAPGEYALIEVADSGEGMSKEILERSLQPFFTTHSMRRGLGLSVVAGVVKAHAGAFRIESTPGNGTRARLWLPLAGAQSFPAPPTSKSMRFPPGTRILIVDDEDLVRAVLKAMLERKGCEVLTASNGREGVDVVVNEGGRLNAILLDLNMPVLDGEQTLEELSQTRLEVPIWIMTGYDAGDREERLAARGIRGILRKPLSSESLFQTLAADLASRAGPHDQVRA